MIMGMPLAQGYYGVPWNGAMPMGMPYPPQGYASPTRPAYPINAAPAQAQPVPQAEPQQQQQAEPMAPLPPPIVPYGYTLAPDGTAVPVDQRAVNMVHSTTAQTFGPYDGTRDILLLDQYFAFGVKRWGTPGIDPFATAQSRRAQVWVGPGSPLGDDAAKVKWSDHGLIYLNPEYTEEAITAALCHVLSEQAEAWGCFPVWPNQAGLTSSRGPWPSSLSSCREVYADLWQDQGWCPHPVSTTSLASRVGATLWSGGHPARVGTAPIDRSDREPH
jgi:hypothetical protein